MDFTTFSARTQVTLSRETGRLSIAPLQPGAMRGGRTLGLKKQFPSSRNSPHPAGCWNVRSSTTITNSRGSRFTHPSKAEAVSPDSQDTSRLISERIRKRKAKTEPTQVAAAFYAIRTCSPPANGITRHQTARFQASLFHPSNQKFGRNSKLLAPGERNSGLHQQQITESKGGKPRVSKIRPTSPTWLALLPLRLPFSNTHPVTRW